MFPSTAILALLAASAQVLCSPVPLRLKNISSSKLVARQDTSSLLGLLSLSSGSGESKYTPPEICTDACGAFVNDLSKCDDDSCVCSQEGLVDFVLCAQCDDRISKKHGVVNMTAVVEDFRELCEYQNYTMSSFTVPASFQATATSTSETAYNISAGTALHLTSAAYASLSIHSDEPLPTFIAAKTTAVPVIAGQAQHSGAAAMKVESATLHGLLCWAGFVIGWMVLAA